MSSIFCYYPSRVAGWRAKLLTTVDSPHFTHDFDRILQHANQHLGAAGRRVARFIAENRQLVLASSAAALGPTDRHV